MTTPTARTDNATLVERRDLSQTLAIFRVRPDRIPPEGQPWFVPGQYTVLGLDVEGQGPVQRTFSMASAPEDRRWLEFYIRRNPEPHTERPFTHLLWSLQEGGRLSVGGKYAGRFTVRHTVGDDPRCKVMIAGGTGVAPFVSLVRSRVLRGVSLDDLLVLHGVSHPPELGYAAELEQRLDVGGRRHFFPTVSRPARSAGWYGHTGRVESWLTGESLRRLERESALGPGGLRPDRAVVYVCGYQGTLAESIRRLLGRGFIPQDRRTRRLLEIPDERPASLFFEQYDLEPLFGADEVESLRALAR